MDTISVDAEVNHHSKTYPYKFIYFPSTFNQFIDFSRSRLYINSNGWIGDILFKNYEHYEMTKQEFDDLNKEEAERTGSFKKQKSIKLLEL